jgi:hypothetical protein
MAPAQEAPPAAAPRGQAAPPEATMDTFLDRLMWAESGGRADAKNPRSTALGPFQFIASTFLEVVRRYFAAETAGLGDEQVLALRTDMAFSRRAALAYTNDNAAHLASHNLPATAANLRLAFLVGPAAAVRVLLAAAETPAAELLSEQAMAANPFLQGMSAGDLLRRAAADIAGAGETGGRRGFVLAAAGPRIAVKCNLGLASCRKWLALARKRAQRTARAGD